MCSLILLYKTSRNQGELKYVSRIAFRWRGGKASCVYYYNGLLVELFSPSLYLILKIKSRKLLYLFGLLRYKLLYSYKVA